MYVTDKLGKNAEQKIKEWLDRPEDGYDFQRLPDQLSGFYGSSNICDFELYKYPNHYWIESKATWHDRFDLSMLTEIQYNGLLDKSKIEGVDGIVIVLFATYKRAFWISIQELEKLKQSGKKSLNITKIDKWPINYHEIKTIPNNRKKLLDYDKEQEFI